MNAFCTTPNSGGARRGFTFVEILAAMLFMAIVIPVTIEGILSANRIGQVAVRKRIAAQLADQMLTETLVENTWQAGELSGDFGEDFPNYAYSIHLTDWSEDSNLGLLLIEVTYMVQGKTYAVTLSTLVDKDVNNTSTNTNTNTSPNSGMPS